MLDDGFMTVVYIYIAIFCFIVVMMWVAGASICYDPKESKLGLRSTIKELKKVIYDLQKQTAEDRITMNEQSERIENLISRNEMLEHNLQSADTVLDKRNKEIEELTDKLEKVAGNRNLAWEKESRLSAQIDNLMQEKDKLQSQIDVHKSDKEAMCEVLSNIEKITKCWRGYEEIE